MNPLKELEECGQSVWLDYLKRSLITSGELHELIERDGLKGVTSNPSIFEKAIGESDEYADALKQLQAQGDHGIAEIYENLAIADIRAAAELLRPVYYRTQGQDGYISLECSPYLANDTEATVGDDWTARKADFPDYASGSDGPKTADDLLARGARAWRPVSPPVERKLHFC